MYIATACTYTYFPGEQYPPPKKNRGATLSWNHVRRTGTQFRPRGTRPIQPRDTATGGANTGVRPGLDLPASAATTGVRPTQTEGHRQRDTDRGTQTEGHRQRDTDRGTQTEGRVANVTKGIRPVRYGQRTLVSVVEPLSGQPCGLSVGKGSSYAATDSYGDESSRQRT